MMSCTIAVLGWSCPRSVASSTALSASSSAISSSPSSARSARWEARPAPPLRLAYGSGAHLRPGSIHLPRVRANPRRWSARKAAQNGRPSTTLTEQGFVNLKAESLLRLRKALVYLAGHQLIEHSVPARTQSRGKFSQMRGFIVRAKTKSRNQVCRSCCDLISAGTKKRQSHRDPSIC